MSMKFPTTEELQARCADPSTVVFASMWDRIGITGWMTQLEYTYFRPDTPANEQINVFMMKWPDNFPMFWVLVQIPRTHEKVAKELLYFHGLKVGGENDPEGARGYTFMVLGPKGEEKFPLQGENIFCLENHSKGTKHVAYTNDPEKLKAAKAAEDEIVKRFHDEHETWLSDPDNYAAAEAYWASRPDLYPPEQQPPPPPAPPTPRRF
jgi:hypothetical protein